MDIFNNYEAAQISGGTQAQKRDNLCAEVQEMASKHGSEWTSEQWDRWGEMFDRECAGGSNPQ